jgi:xylulokinase
MARCTAGLEANMTDARRWARTSHVVEPRPLAAAPVADRYQRFLDLTRALDEP